MDKYNQDHFRLHTRCLLSKSYGESFAKALRSNVVNERVDQVRNTVLISGSDARNNPFETW